MQRRADAKCGCGNPDSLVPRAHGERQLSISSALQLIVIGFPFFTMQNVHLLRLVSSVRLIGQPDKTQCSIGLVILIVSSLSERIRYLARAYVAMDNVLTRAKVHVDANAVSLVHMHSCRSSRCLYNLGQHA